MKVEVLNNVANQKLRPRRAYRLLYKKRRAYFYKLRFDVRDSKHISRFLNFLFLCPTPIFILSVIINITLKDVPKDVRKTAIRSLKHQATRIEILADEVIIKIKAI